MYPDETLHFRAGLYFVRKLSLNALADVKTKICAVEKTVRLSLSLRTLLSTDGRQRVEKRNRKMKTLVTNN